MKELCDECQHNIQQRLLSNKDTNRTSLTLTDITDVLTEAVLHYNQELEAVEPYDE